MASLPSCVLLLLTALCWAGGTVTDPCDLDNGGTWEDCWYRAIAGQKYKLAKRINASDSPQITPKRSDYSFTNIRLTGARKFQVSKMSRAIFPNLKRLKIWLIWTDSKLKMTATKGTKSNRIRIGFTAILPISCWMKSPESSLQPLTLYRTDISTIQIKYNKNSLDHMKLYLENQFLMEGAKHATNLIDEIVDKTKIKSELRLTMRFWLVHYALPTLARTVKGTI